jgi:hypothetical protein
MAAETKAEALGMLARTRAKLKTIRENSEQTINTVIGTAEASGTAFLLEYARGRNGTIDDEGHLELMVGGVPVSLIVGLGGHVAGFMGLGGKASSHLHNVATGGLAAYTAQMGLRMGQKSANQIDTDAGKSPRFKEGAGSASILGGHARMMGGHARMMGGASIPVSPYASHLANPAYAR